MTDPHPDDRPAPRWLHVWAILTAAVTLLLLVLGQMVTTFRAGMADPVWPTEPWYLASNYKLDFGYLIEHTHRIAGWAVGALAAGLALGAWWTEPRPMARWVGLTFLVMLLGAFGQFHRAMIAQRDAAQIAAPMDTVAEMGLSLGVVLVTGLSGLFGAARGSGIRLLAVAVLVAVMVQGLLGGLRVRLNDILGPELAQYHGVFGQAVFALMAATVAATAKRPATPLGVGSRVVRVGALVLVGLVFTQIVWGALVRHNPTPLAQRMHLMEAFLVAGTAVWVRLRVVSEPGAKERTKLPARAIDVLLLLQVMLGVEAWMGKFAGQAVAAAAQITPHQAGIRTAHALVGACLLAASVALAVRLWVRQGEPRRAGRGADENARADRAGAVVVELGGRA